MANTDALSLLPKAAQEEMRQLILGRLQAAQQQADQIRPMLAELEASIKGYQEFLSQLGEPVDLESAQTKVEQGTGIRPVNMSTMTEVYDKDWTQATKILYVLRCPEKYGLPEPTFIGAGSVVKALKCEEPELGKEGNASLLRRFGPTISRMAQNGEVVRAVETDSKNRIHYLSPEWFHNGKLLLIHQPKTRNLEFTNLDLFTKNKRQP